MANEIKKELRKEYLQILKNISQTEKTQWDENIFQQFTTSEYLQQYQTFALYFSLPYEVDTIRIINFLLKEKKQVALPRMKDSELQFYFINSLDDVVIDNQWKIGQPKDTNSIVKVADLDLIIVPLVAFNQKKYRLGHGKGYYDRFLSNPECKAFKLGLAYQVQEIANDVFFVDNWDIPFDAIITNN